MAGLEVYHDADDEWRWRAVAANGRIVANGGEGYKNRADCERGSMLAVGVILAALSEVQRASIFEAVTLPAPPPTRPNRRTRREIARRLRP